MLSCGLVHVPERAAIGGGAGGDARRSAGGEVRAGEEAARRGLRSVEDAEGTAAGQMGTA